MAAKRGGNAARRPGKGARGRGKGGPWWRAALARPITRQRKTKARSPAKASPAAYALLLLVVGVGLLGAYKFPWTSLYRSWFPKPVPIVAEPGPHPTPSPPMRTALLPQVPPQPPARPEAAPAAPVQTESLRKPEAAQAALEAPRPPSSPKAVVPGQPALAIIIDDVGPDRSALRELAEFTGPLTLSFLPYAPDLSTATAAARQAGHEVFLHLNMEPEGRADPGPQALYLGLGDAELRRRTRWALDQVGGAVGVNNHMGSRLTADEHAMEVVMAELGRYDVAFVDSRTTPRSVAEVVAKANGIPAAGRDVFVDNERVAAAISAELDRAEQIARRTGSAIAIGHPYPETIATLRTWMPEARRRGVLFVTASALVALRECGIADTAASARCAKVASVHEVAKASPR